MLNVATSSVTRGYLELNVVAAAPERLNYDQEEVFCIDEDHIRSPLHGVQATSTSLTLNLTLTLRLTPALIPSHLYKNEMEWVSEPNLPPCLQLDPFTGVIEGYVQESSIGVTLYQIQAANISGDSKTTIRLEVSPNPAKIRRRKQDEFASKMAEIKNSRFKAGFLETAPQFIHSKRMFEKKRIEAEIAKKEIEADVLGQKACAHSILNILKT